MIELLSLNENILRTKYHVQELLLFGSISKGNYNDYSDIDLLVSFNEPVGVGFLELVIFLNSILPRNVDLLTMNGVKKRFFEEIIKQSVKIL